MATRTTGLPVHDIHLRILDYIVADCKTWDDSRQYLHLRLLSKDLGLHFARALLRNVRLVVTSDESTWSANIGYLLCLFTSDGKPATYVKHLSIVNGRPGPAEAYWPNVPVIEHPVTASDARMDEALAYLVKLCTQVEVLDLETANVDKASVPLFSQQLAREHPKLRKVILRDAAPHRHILDYLTAGLCKTSLTIVSAQWSSDVHLRVPKIRRLVIRVAMLKTKFPRLWLDTLHLCDSTASDLEIVRSCQGIIRPRRIFITVSSYNGNMRDLDEHVYNLVNAYWARAAKEICFKSRDGVLPDSGLLERIEKIKAAVPSRAVKYE